MESPMRHTLFLLVSVVLAATRSLALQSSGNAGARPTITADVEYRVLLFVIVCLTGLLVFLWLTMRVPYLGAAITEINHF